MQAIARKALAVVVVTEGPTGGIIALNEASGRYAWPVPVVLVGAAQAGPLAQAAAAGSAVTLMSTGDASPQAAASNVVGRRAGQGKAIVVSTPKSGWFHCAGERGSGLALFWRWPPGCRRRRPGR